jgi:hypothetical protein
LRNKARCRRRCKHLRRTVNDLKDDASILDHRQALSSLASRSPLQAGVSRDTHASGIDRSPADQFCAVGLSAGRRDGLFILLRESISSTTPSA